MSHKCIMSICVWAAERTAQLVELSFDFLPVKVFVSHCHSGANRQEVLMPRFTIDVLCEEPSRTHDGKDNTTSRKASGTWRRSEDIIRCRFPRKLYYYCVDKTKSSYKL